MEAQPELPRLYADQVQLERVLDNLLGNALRHTAEGGQIRLQARRHGERVIISVEDNGEGIAYGQQGRIFEPFVQVGRKKGGAGLGLALCKEIVQLHGGRMGVYSRPGQGTQFYMAYCRASLLAKNVNDNAVLSGSPRRLCVLREQARSYIIILHHQR